MSADPEEDHKILVLTDALGNLVRFRLMPGNRYDSVDVPPLINGVAFDGLIADKAFDSKALVAELNERGAKVVISQHPARAQTPRRPRRHLHFTPMAASRLNLVEGWFALLARPCLQRGIFQSTDGLDFAIAADIEHANAEPRPFAWTKSADAVLGSVGRLSSSNAYPRLGPEVCATQRRSAAGRAGAGASAPPVGAFPFC